MENQIDESKGPYTPPTQTPPNRKPLSLFKKIFIIVVGTVCLFGIWSTVFPDKKTDTAINNITQGTDPKTLTPTTAVQWKKYVNKIYHYTVSYPTTLRLNNTASESALLYKQTNPGNDPSLYVSAMQNGRNNANTKMYNYMSTDVINSIAMLQDGASIKTPTGIYQKLATIPIAGTKGFVTQTNKIVNDSTVVHDRRVIVQKDGVTYIVGGYFQTQAELDTLFRFVSSFTFIQ
jgi:hypothetical protein